MELRLTKTQLQSCVWKRSSSSAEAAFKMVQAAALGYIQKKKKTGLKLELRLLNAAPTFTELRLIKRSFNSYGAAFYETQL